MSRFISSSTAVMLAVLAACATQAQNQENSIHLTVDSAVSAQKACITSIVQSPTYSALWVHFPQIVETATLEQMASSDVATRQDAKLLYELRDNELPCNQSMIRSFDSVSPNLGAPFQSYLSLRDQGIILVSEDKITWGQFVSALVKAKEDTNASYQDAMDQIDGQLEQENQEEQAQRAQALQSFANYMQAQQAIEEANRPINSNCNTFGTQTTCTSY